MIKYLIFTVLLSLVPLCAANFPAVGVWPPNQHIHMGKGVHFIIGSSTGKNCAQPLNVGQELMLNADCTHGNPRFMVGIQKGTLRTRPTGGMCATFNENNIVYLEWCDRNKRYPDFYLDKGLLKHGDLCLTASETGVATMGACLW